MSAIIQMCISDELNSGKLSKVLSVFYSFVYALSLSRQGQIVNSPAIYRGE